MTRAAASLAWRIFENISITFALNEENEFPNQKQTEFTFIPNNGSKVYFLPIGKVFSVHAVKT